MHERSFMPSADYVAPKKLIAKFVCWCILFCYSGWDGAGNSLPTLLHPTEACLISGMPFCCDRHLHRPARSDCANVSKSDQCDYKCDAVNRGRSPSFARKLLISRLKRKIRVEAAKLRRLPPLSWMVGCCLKWGAVKGNESQTGLSK